MGLVISTGCVGLVTSTFLSRSSSDDEVITLESGGSSDRFTPTIEPDWVLPLMT